MDAEFKNYFGFSQSALVFDIINFKNRKLLFSVDF